MEEVKKEKTYSVGTLTYTLGGVVVLFCWLLWGDFAWSMKDRAMVNIAAIIVEKFDISNTLYGLLIVSYPAFTNIFLQPIISYKSDRYRSKWGRRIPFILATTPFVVVGVIGIGFSPMLGKWFFELCGGSISLNTASLIMFSVFWVILDIGATLSGALAGALYNDVVPTALIGRFYALFRAISLGAGVLFNVFLLGHVSEYYAWICLGLGILYGAGLLSMCLKVKEGEYPPPELGDEKESGKKGWTEAVSTYFRESFSHPYYLCVFFGFTLASMTFMPINIFMIFYAGSVGMSLKLLGYYMGSSYAISFLLCYVLGDLADRFHPIRMMIVSLGLYAIVMAVGGLYVHDVTYFGIMMVFHSVFSGAFYTMSASYGMRLLPRERFATLNSAMGIFGAISNVIAAPLFGGILDILNRGGGAQEISQRDYHYTYHMGFVVALLSIAMLLIVLKGYNKYGGDKNYVPPQV